MPRFTINVTHKRQTKMNDCWYACIQMLLSTRYGEKTKPFGNAVAEHRSRKIIVLCGVDPDNDMVQFEDPGWFRGNYWKPLDYLGKMWVTPEAAVTLPPIDA